MAESGYNARRAARQIDALVNRSRTRLYTHSPNDVLVQIALPLILILAIMTRLTMVAYNMLSQRDMAPAVMELWKQQVILRVDRVLTAWERDANLAVFPDFTHVRLEDTWPNDTRFSRLCLKASALDDPVALRQSILNDALASQTAATPGAVEAIIPVADLMLEPGSAEATYAENYVAQRIGQWIDQVVALHWETVAHVAQNLPLATQASADDARTQLHLIADELKARGYPLIAAVSAEYGNPETAP